MRATTALLLTAGCAALLGPTVVRWVPAVPADKQKHESTLERRDACLKPPFSLQPGKSIVLSGLRIEERTEGPRELTLSTAAAGVPLDADGLIDFKTRNEVKLRAIAGIEETGLSGCIAASKQLPCISLQLRMCQQPLDAVAAALNEIIAADGLTRGAFLVFHVILTGAVGPRCEANETSCRPEPYEAAIYRPGERRGLVTDVKGEPECTWDGECKKAGCGNSCAPWTKAHLTGTCQGRPELHEALCGCVERRCAWFVQ